MGRLSNIFRNPFSFFLARSRTDEAMAAYVIREHERGRPLAEILEDGYLRNRATPQQLARLLDRPEVVRALGESTVSAEQDRLS